MPYVYMEQETLEHIAGHRLPEYLKNLSQEDEAFLREKINGIRALGDSLCTYITVWEEGKKKIDMIDIAPCIQSVIGFTREDVLSLGYRSFVQRFSDADIKEEERQSLRVKDELKGTDSSTYALRTSELQHTWVSDNSFIHELSNGVRVAIGVLTKKPEIEVHQSELIARLDKTLQERDEALATEETRRQEAELEKAALEQQVSILAHDKVTKLWGPAFFAEVFDQRLVEAVRHNKDLACIYIDLDDFKPINTKYDHRGGDLALLAFANFLKLVLRKEDIVGRVGGDEFCIVLPETNKEGGVESAQRLLSEMERYKKMGKVPGNPFYSEELDVVFDFGMTLGISAKGECEDTTSAITKTADGRLNYGKYQVKKGDVYS